MKIAARVQEFLKPDSAYSGECSDSMRICLILLNHPTTVHGGAETLPKGQDGDLYFMRSILHDWNEENALAILKACRTAIGSASARVLLAEVNHSQLRVWGLLVMSSSMACGSDRSLWPSMNMCMLSGASHLLCHFKEWQQLSG